MITSRCPGGKTVSALTLFMLVLLTFPGAVNALSGQQAENGQPTLSYEGQKVTSVEVAGQPDLSRRAVDDLIAQPINAPYHQQQIDDTVDALQKSGKYTGVKVQVTPEAFGLRVLFVL